MPSYYEALPIFRAAMDLAVRIDKAVQCFPRRHKYTLGAKLRDSSERVVVMVARANRRAERGRWLEALCNEVRNVKHRYLAYLFEPLESEKEEG